MRRFLIPILMAGAMIPAAAMAQDRDGESDRRAEQRAERAEHRIERAERSSDERPQRQERVMQVERAERPQIERAERSQIERIQNVAREPRFERRERRIEQVQQVEQVQQAPTQQVRVYQQRGVLGGLRETVRQQQTLEARPATRDGRRDGHWGGQRDGRDWHRDGDRDHRWSSDWRRDHRYDWYRYRDRNRSIFRLGHYYDPYGWGYRRFSIGFSLGRSYYGSNYWLDDAWMYRLPPVYGPYRWVRYYDDALLVNIYTGQVVDVVYDVFW